MKASHTHSHAPHHASRRGTCGSQLLAFVLTFTFLVGVRAVSAETSAPIPGVAVHPTAKAIAVDSVKHYVFTVDASDHIQVTFVSSGAWATASLGGGEPVVTGSMLYVDTGYHYLYYVGPDFNAWCWLFNGTAWQNVQLTSSGTVANLVGVDSTSHIIWFNSTGSALSSLISNGTTWVPTASGVSNPGSSAGGIVDDTSHSLYWSDVNAGNLRRLVWTGNDFAPSALVLDSNSDGYSRPAVHTATREVYFVDGGGELLWRYVPGLVFTKQGVGPNSDKALPSTPIAVNPLNGHVIYNRNTGSFVGEIAFVSPVLSGSSAWPRTSVAGTTGQTVKSCAVDNGNGRYFYTITTDTVLRVVF